MEIDWQKWLGAKARVIETAVRIEKIVPNGQGLGTLSDGKKVFLYNALPGELVEAMIITKNKTRYAEGFAVKVTELAAQRIQPKDESFLATAPWQIYQFAFELEMKRELVLESLREAKIQLTTEVMPTQTDYQEYFYRNKMEYALYYEHESGKIWPSVRMRGTHRKIPIQQSSLERPEIWSQAERIVQQMRIEGLEARDFQALLLRSNQAGEVSGGLLKNGEAHPRFPLLTDQILGQDFTYSPNGFFQVNLPVYEMALRAIAEEIDGKKVLDLYAGVGSIGLSVACKQDVTLVEVNGSAYRELVKNCQKININTKRIRPILAPAEQVLDLIKSDQIVIVDPPRAGCDQKLIERLLTVLPPKIIYLSCNPATQARDVAGLVNHYQLTKVQPFNFFPHTPHIENLIVLQRR